MGYFRIAPLAPLALKFLEAWTATGDRRQRPESKEPNPKSVFKVKKAGISEISKNANGLQGRI